MEIFWSKEDLINKKNNKTSNRILSSRAKILSRYSLVLSILSLIITTSSFVLYTNKQQDVNYKVSYQNGQIQDIKDIDGYKQVR